MRQYALVCLAAVCATALVGCRRSSDTPAATSVGEVSPTQGAVAATQVVSAGQASDLVAMVNGQGIPLAEFGDRLMLGEIYLPIERLVSYYGPDGPAPHVPFNFQLIQLPWTATAIATIAPRRVTKVTINADSASARKR